MAFSIKARRGHISFFGMDCMDKNNPKIKRSRLVFSAIFLFILFSIVLYLTLFEQDKKEYERVLSSMSLKDASVFFNKYHNSKYSCILAGDIAKWCRQEPNLNMLRMALQIIPKDYPQNKEIKSEYESLLLTNKK